MDKKATKKKKIKEETVPTDTKRFYETDMAGLKAAFGAKAINEVERSDRRCRIVCSAFQFHFWWVTNMEVNWTIIGGSRVDDLRQWFPTGEEFPPGRNFMSSGEEFPLCS